MKCHECERSVSTVLQLGKWIPIPNLMSSPSRVIPKTEMERPEVSTGASAAALYCRSLQVHRAGRWSWTQLKFPNYIISCDIFCYRSADNACLQNTQITPPLEDKSYHSADNACLQSTQIIPPLEDKSYRSANNACLQNTQIIPPLEDKKIFPASPLEQGFATDRKQTNCDHLNARNQRTDVKLSIGYRRLLSSNQGRRWMNDRMSSIHETWTNLGRRPFLLKISHRQKRFQRGELGWLVLPRLTGPTTHSVLFLELRPRVKSAPSVSPKHKPLGRVITLP